MKKYPLPEEVTSPRLHWTLMKVLHKGDPHDPGIHHAAGYSMAVGMWDGNPCLGIRWNANEERPVGNPQSRGLPIWFIVPEPLVAPILSTLGENEKAIALSLLNL